MSRGQKEKDICCLNILVFLVRLLLLLWLSTAKEGNMAIFTDNTTADLFKIIQSPVMENNVSDGLFAGHLQEQMANLANSDSQEPADGEYSDDISMIKEKGLVSYIMELHEKKIREEILASMGLTEEDLAKMPPEQRAAIEKIIAEETQKRLAAESILQDGDDQKTGTNQQADKTQLKEIAFGIKAIEDTVLSAEKKEKEDR